MGSMGSSGAVYRMVTNIECSICGQLTATIVGEGQEYCAYCYGLNHDRKMNDPPFTLQEIEASKDLINKLSNQ